MKKEIESISNFNFDVLSQNSSRYCYPGSSGGWIRFSVWLNLSIKTTGSFTENIRMIAFINGRDINFCHNWQKKWVIEIGATKKNDKIQNDCGGGVYIVWRVIEKIAKKLKLKSQDPAGGPM